ncbi:thiol:disulfide interchange protein DsbA/DsbL [Simplicispira psychrophila]|uniref:thiol:disulfide interchange protein DsbA/DsbL n=1 Tax=Simplicispira psychrophila TaxID=80882 RepID=UPI000483B3EB|nr:thiol:disulfide interchange protein DsbA/DsbL [Simplicispira psychrophila]
MKRRDFSLSAASALAASALSLPALAQSGAFKEGKDYAKLAKPVASSAPAGQVEVIEFFWYNCSHCNEFEPTFANWVKTAPKNASVHRVPVAFNASFAPQQKLYYTLEGMGKVDELHARVFRAIHVERQNLSKEEAIFAWMAKQPGVDMAKFKETYNSFTVSNQVRRATQLQQDYSVEGVPSMGVAGRYYTDGTMAGSMPGVLAVVNHLIGISAKA